MDVEEEKERNDGGGATVVVGNGEDGETSSLLLWIQQKIRMQSCRRADGGEIGGVRCFNGTLVVLVVGVIQEVMDRSWMYHAPRSSQTFVNGVQTFLTFAFERISVNGGKIKCPCTKCLNMIYQSRQNVLDHLICSGFRPEYLKWVYHGEGTTTASTSTTLNDEMHDLLNDAFEPEGGIGVEVHENASNSHQETNYRGSKFDDLVKEFEEKTSDLMKWHHTERVNNKCSS
ncbi:hypothetical protein QVD17_07185 [Tagetes erecta]|uniref:Transposase-associated domain-containing protein n=1 Tax=Tagetes erecta TaxID=13708 RepID=A0AAD8LKX4_TARER|nr:hypothetical protein QVD17_07185 [Tagetes erecta]